MAVNVAIVSGNIVRDPEYRLAGQTAILNGSVAVNSRKKNHSTGEWEDYANFIDFTLFGKRAESLKAYLTKGTKVTISGSLKQNRWQDKDGNNRSKLEIIVDELELGSGGEKRQSSGSSSIGDAIAEVGGTVVSGDDIPW